ncbi:MAG: glycolate oxidase subunit GlcF [Verrucomicrobia bacterium]|nr:glycolate oxidase subunit GlcF [Verrucomicrobiota bacterium]MBV8276130.1 glycolate oxidase subunit GlcF [Verrucomicrobiota bacterium]
MSESLEERAGAPGTPGSGGNAERNGLSAYDAHHPPAGELIDQCVHCGFCLPACPTYVLWREEMDSPRGRIYLMKMAAEGDAAINETWVNHFDACLGCMACMTACPSGVDYGKLIEATRAQIERRYTRPSSEKGFRRFLFSTFTRPERLSLLALPLRLFQKTGLQALVRRIGIPKLLPKRLQAMEALLPQVPAPEKIPELIPAQGERRRRVGLLLGCVQRVFFPQVNAATARVLAAEGCEVVAPAAQSCCGALLVHTGEEEQAIQLARRTIDLFEKAEVDTVIINAAGCGSTVKDYGHLLRDDPEYADRAKAFSAKCRDILEFLAELEPRAQLNPLSAAASLGRDRPIRVAYHDACHLQHAQRVRSQPRTVLGRIPNLEILEIPEAAICCGSAGIYNLVQPETAAELGDRKAGHVTSLSPDMVVSSNPGCLLQLQSSLARAGRNLAVHHGIELVDASIRGVRL